MFSGTTATEKPITLNTPIDTYIAHYSGRDKARRYRVGWWRSRLGDRAVTSITDDDIFRTLETYANAPARVYAGRDARREPIFRAKRGTPSGGSINRHHAALSAVIKWGIQRRLLPKGYTNPARLIERRKESLGRVRFLTDQQRKRLVEAARSSTWGSPESMLV